ncbi:MAG: amino acid adenylation domain-containing protein [Chloroflexota bacterium]
MTSSIPYDTSNLTNAQQLMWIGQQLQPDVPLYNMMQTFIIHGNIDVDVFTQAFETLVAQSENMRLSIEVINDIPIGRTDSTSKNVVAFYDFTQESDPQSHFDNWLDIRRGLRFDLSGQLYDCALIKLGDAHFVWYLAMHHIITDATAFKLIFEQVSDYYLRLKEGESLNLAGEALPQHADYKTYEQLVIESKSHAKARAYWQQQLAHEVEPIRFYAPQDATDKTASVRVNVPLADTTCEALVNYIENAPIRSFSKDLITANVFASLLFSYLYRISGHNNLRLGMPLANRSTPQFTQTIGAFIEVLSLTLDIADDDSFEDVLRKVNKVNLKTLQHLLPAVSSAEHTHAYDVVMNFIPLHFSDFAEMPTEVAWVHCGHGDANHKLNVQIYDMNNTGHYQFFFDFNTDIFNADDRARAMTHFEAVIEQCIASPQIPLSDIDLLTSAEKEAFLGAFNATDTPYQADATIVDLFEAQVAKTPTAITVVDSERQLTYAELNGKANALAHELQSVGIRTETFVPVCMHHSIDLVVALWGILKAGGVYVPLDPQYPTERMQYILDDIGDVPLIITDAELEEQFTDIGTKTRIVDADSVSLLDDFTHDVTPQSLAYVIYTSGSTGNPKGVLVEHDGLSNYVQWASKHYVPDTAATFALYSSLAFDLTVTSIYVPLVTGGSIRVYYDAENTGTVIRDIFIDAAVDVVKLTPSHLELVRDLDLSATRIKRLIVGGEDFKVSLARAIHDTSAGNIVLFNEYGPTEATVACMLHQFDAKGDTQESVPIGTPADNMRVYVLDKHLKPVPTGIVGEMYLSGVGVARAYLNRDVLSAERFLPDPFDSTRHMYKSGDLARWLPDGTLTFLGRADRQVKLRGYRIELGEIEGQLHSISGVESATVVVRTEQLIGYYVADEAITAEIVTSYLSERLPSYMIPTHVVRLDAMPLTINGKVDYDALPDIVSGNVDGHSAYVAPENDVQATVAHIWQTILQIEQIGIHSNFFDIGGHSLPAIRVTGRINAYFDIDMPLKTFFTNPTIAGQADAIERIVKTEIDALSDDEVFRLLEAIDYGG